MLTLYRRIKFYRELRHLTQEELAKMTGYSNRSAIARIERGEIDLPQSKILEFSNALKVPPSMLMGNDGTIFAVADDKLEVSSKHLVYAIMEILNEDGINKLLERAQELEQMPKYVKQNNNRRPSGSG